MSWTYVFTDYKIIETGMQNYNFFISMWNLLARVLNENKTPDSFVAFLQKAKEYCDEHPDQPKLITLFAWNEWIEGAYFLPDMKYGFSYVEALMKFKNLIK